MSNTNDEINWVSNNVGILQIDDAIRYWALVQKVANLSHELYLKYNVNEKIVSKDNMVDMIRKVLGDN